MITLYEGIAATTPATFTSMPYPLIDAIDCTVTEERNGQFSLVLRYPIGGAYWTKIIPDAIITADPRPNADPEPFRIYEIEQVIEGVVTARANHIVYDLDGIGPFSIAAITEYWTNLDDFISSINTGWFQYLNRPFLLVNDGLTSTSSIPQGKGVAQTLWAVIGYIANAFNAELKYEWVNGVCVITFCAARGVQKPAVISYGVNLVSLDRKLYTGNLYSQVCVYYSKNNDLVYGYADTSYTARERTLFVNVTDKFASVPTQEEMDAEAANYVATHDFNPSSDLSVDFVPLENTTENAGTPSVQPISDSAPYVLRNSGGSLDLGIRNRETDSLIGGTIAWNQFVKNGNFNGNRTNWVSSGTATRTVSNNVLTITSSAVNSLQQTLPLANASGHRILFCGTLSATESANFGIYKNSSGTYAASVRPTDGTKVRIERIVTISAVSTDTFDIRIRANTTNSTTITAENINVFDLTQMFGSTIADYAYSLESGTVGAGIAWLKKYGFFTEDYYPYSMTYLQSVKTSAHKTIGFNQWDEEWEVGGIDSSTGANVVGTNTIRAKNNIRIIPNTVYHYKCSATAEARYYDASGNYLASYAAAIIANSNFTTPSDAAFMRFVVLAAYGTTYNHDICINLSKTSGSPKNGDYVPHVEHSYPLDPDLQLRGILKLDASNNLYYDGDTYESYRTVTRKYGIRAYQPGDATDGSTMITDETNTVYILTTPTTESADPYTNPQMVYAGGTEQYVDAAYTAGTRDFEMPVGHSTTYTFVPEDNRLYLCDTATVDASLIGVSATAKCVMVVYNVLTDKYDSVTVGTIQSNIVDTILKLEG